LPAPLLAGAGRWLTGGAGGGTTRCGGFGISGKTTPFLFATSWRTPLAAVASTDEDATLLATPIEANIVKISFGLTESSAAKS